MVAASVIVVTKNESARISSCLVALSAFDDVWVVDSASRDGTDAIAASCGAKVQSFLWSGQYPKKRQWCLDNLPLKYDWVFFVDADEIIPAELVMEMDRVLQGNPPEAGFFVTGRYSMAGKVLRFGIPNRKIALLHRGRMAFPVVDDTDIPGMGEIEGHYQPVFKDGAVWHRIGALHTPLIHDALDDERAWQFRHEKYARWEAGMNKRGAWPIDPVPWREAVKQFLRASPYRPALVFIIGFILKFGFLDGAAGLVLARRKYFYYKMIRKLA